MSFGENVRWRRTMMGITQAQLARMIRLDRHIPDRSYVCRIESGEVDPRLSTVRSLAKALKMRPWMLVADWGDAPNWWGDYLSLSPEQKREVQRHISWLKRGNT